MNNEASPSGLSFAQLFAILRARKFTVLVTLVLTVAGTTGLTLFLPKTYTANAEVFIDFRANDPLAGRQFSPMLDESYMQTQVDMIKSEEVANRVIDATHMMSTDKAKELIVKEGEPRLRSLLVAQVERDLEVVLRKSSRVMELHYSMNNPNGARDALNAAIQAYMDLIQRISLAPAKSRQEQYSAQLETLRHELDTIQTSITDYQQKYGIVDTDERLDTESRQLNELSTRQATVQGLITEAGAKHRAIESMIQSGVPPADIPDVAQQRGIPELRLKLADLDRLLADIGSVYGKNHPKFKSAAAERDILAQRLARESQIALNSVLLEDRRLTQEVQSLNGDIQAKQRKLLEMKKHRDVISSYRRQMESVQNIYNAAVQKYDELLMASNVNTPTLTVLQWATAPYTHSKPKLTTNVLASIPVGLLLGLGLVFLSDLSGRRLRHIDDLERELRLDVLGRVGEQQA